VPFSDGVEKKSSPQKRDQTEYPLRGGISDALKTPLKPVPDVLLLQGFPGKPPNIRAINSNCLSEHSMALKRKDYVFSINLEYGFLLFYDNGMMQKYSVIFFHFTKAKSF